MSTCKFHQCPQYFFSQDLLINLQMIMDIKTMCEGRLSLFGAHTAT